MQSMLSLSLLLLAKMTVGYLAPSPPGRYNVTLTTGPLIDYTRNDSNVTTKSPRALMLSVFQPAKCASTVSVPYMPNKTAAYQGTYLQKQFGVPVDLSPVFLEARLPVCPDDSNSCPPLEDGSILLFSPGYGVPRLYYSVLASAIASEGFTVVTIDHPGDANIITYPDGHAEYYNTSISPTDDEFTSKMYARVADASFIIDQLSNATAMVELLPHRGLKPFPTDRIAMLGHSLGGAAAVLAAAQEPRIRGAINWDGTLFGSLPPSGISKPIMFMAGANHSDPSWIAAWPHLEGPKLWVEVSDTMHQTFSDVPTLLEAAGQNSPAFEGLLGTIAPAELVRIVVAYTKAWMNGVFEGEVGGGLLSGEEGRFEEVEVVRKGNF